MTFRSRPLLDAIASLPCQVRAAPTGCSAQDTVVAAHADLIRMGKGRGIKAADCYSTSCCAACHDYIGGHAGTKVARATKEAAWQAGFERTVLALFERGLIAVAGKKERKEPVYAPPEKVVSREPPPWRK